MPLLPLILRLIVLFYEFSDTRCLAVSLFMMDFPSLQLLLYSLKQIQNNYVFNISTDCFVWFFAATVFSFLLRNRAIDCESHTSCDLELEHHYSCYKIILAGLEFPGKSYLHLKIYRRDVNRHELMFL